MSKILLFIILFLLFLSSVTASTMTRYGFDFKIVGGEISFKVSDRLGSDRLTFDDEKVIAESNVLPYGQQLKNNAVKFSFTDKELDDTDNYYFNARYYDYDSGKFLGVDPVSNNHAYAFVSNNPMNYVDPSGMVELKSNEYIVPKEVLRAMYFSSMDITEDWDKYESTGALGVSIKNNYLEGSFFDFLPVVKSKKERFYELVSVHTDVSKADAKKYYNILTTKGNIALAPNFKESILFHERIHKYMTEELTSTDLNLLYETRRKFISWMQEETVDVELLGENCKISFQTAHSSNILIPPIIFGSKQELYAYMAQYQIYPELIGWGRNAIDDEIYEAFKEQYPEVYAIYEEMVNNVKKSMEDSETDGGEGVIVNAEIDDEDN